MSLRELVSGAGCGADGASGSGSNPAAGFADALLGGTSKAHEGQLRQLPGAARRCGVRQAAAKLSGAPRLRCHRRADSAPKPSPLTTAAQA
jgi:hypothetical protein